MKLKRLTRLHRLVGAFAFVAVAGSTFASVATADARATLSGPVLLTARVTLGGAYECKWSSNVPTRGLPAFRRCRHGEVVRRTVDVPVNDTSHARRIVYSLSEYDMSSVFPKIVIVKRILQNAASATPVATTTVLTNTTVGPTGQDVVLTATVSPTPSAGTVTFLASSAGANPTVIAQCASVPISPTTGTATCSYPLNASVGFQANYSGATKGLGADWAPSWSTLLTLSPASST